VRISALQKLTDIFSAFELHATLYYCALTTCVYSTVVNYGYNYYVIYR